MSDRRATRWVLLRGLTRGAAHWGDFAQRLDAALPLPEPALAIDLPGNGTRHRERSPARVDAMVEALRASLHAAKGRPPYRVVAMSLGAMVAIEWARRRPGEIESAALINTSLRPFSPPWQRLRPAAFARLLGLLLRGADARAWERAILALTTRQAPAGTLERWIALREAQPVGRANALRQLLAAARFRAPTDAPAARLLLLASARDALVDPRCSQALQAAWRLEADRRHEHAGAGHDLPLDDAAWVIERLRALDR
ncbi:MAG TPA: alpha/beta fold hydrolase [Methylibium sp.]|uniref:alpha/beta fold hydrolase n=1 Tax=Methylibium sp. TaxID=2067992 RepID=UPI002DB5AE4E|nr:alpha/beta fold hydrolase [Methylibium sp.]HEU4458693.1 alpha/beta fold hydrolase [Methylibium sp.]